jgi:putative DNA primase/helicase
MNTELNTIEQPFQQLDMPFADTETGNRDRFVSRNQGKCLYIPELKCWTIWDGARWKKVGIAPIMKLADETAKSIFNEARDCHNSEGVRRLSSWAVKSQSEQKLRVMINMAASWHEMTASLEEFDSDPNLLNCLNGVIHLPSGELLGHHPSHKLMKLAPVEYKPHSRCPNFDKFIKEIFLNDKELISWMQLGLGYQLTGHTSEQVFFASYGTGANGKSTLYETILKILGDYGGTMQFETLLAGEKSNTRVLEAVGKLRGKRMVIASEVDSNRRLNEAHLKQLTGGDTLTGTNLYSGTFEFLPTHKINMLANHMPYTKDASYGMERRIKIIPYQRKFSAEERDITLPNKLLDEKEGILAWLTRGAKRWYSSVESNNGNPALGSCHAVDEATQNYINDNDTFGAFLVACTDKDTEAMVNASDLYVAYQDWSRENGEQYQMGTGVFSSRLQERGYTKKRTNKGNVYLGLSLNPEAAGNF